MVGPITASQAPQPPVRTRTGIAAADPRLRPPGGAPPLVLRV
jgi:hypothetical protein